MPPPNFVRFLLNVPMNGESQPPPTEIYEPWGNLRGWSPGLMAAAVIVASAVASGASWLYLQSAPAFFRCVAVASMPAFFVVVCLSTFAFRYGHRKDAE
jgi:hypothetical protein